MSVNAKIIDYSRYFSLRQKVYLVKMSAEQSSEIYESLGGVVISSALDKLELMVSYSSVEDEVEKSTYKLTTEVFGSGIQVLGDLTGIIDGNIFQFQMRGAMEMFQRRSVSRAEFSTSFFHLRGNFPLAAFKKEWRRVMSHLADNGSLPGLVMKETLINLGAGGMGFTVDESKKPTPLSMFFIGMDEGLPVCALGETVWEQGVAEGLRCGFRFIHILKADQERINNCVSDLIRKSGGTPLDFRRNWVLVDKMVADERKSG